MTDLQLFTIALLKTHNWQKRVELGLTVLVSALHLLYLHLYLYLYMHLYLYLSSIYGSLFGSRCLEAGLEASLDTETAGDHGRPQDATGCHGKPQREGR